MDIRSFCLDTEGFTIRSLAADDQGLFCRLFTDEGTMKHIGPAMSEESAASLFASALRANQRYPSRDLFWTIDCRHTRTAIGICTLQRIDWNTMCGEIGMMLTAAKQNRGVGPEVLSGLITAFFERFGLRSLKASYHADNIVAERMFAGRGFTPTSKSSHDPSVRIAALTIETWRASKSNANDSLSMSMC